MACRPSNRTPGSRTKSSQLRQTCRQEPQVRNRSLLGCISSGSMTIRIILPQDDRRYGKPQLAPVRIFLCCMCGSTRCPIVAWKCSIYTSYDRGRKPCSRSFSVAVNDLWGGRVVVQPSWAEHLVYHEIWANVQELIAPGYAADLGIAYDHGIRSVWEFCESMKPCPNEGEITTSSTRCWQIRRKIPGGWREISSRCVANCGWWRRPTRQWRPRAKASGGPCRLACPESVTPPGAFARLGRPYGA